VLIEANTTGKCPHCGTRVYFGAPRDLGGTLIFTADASQGFGELPAIRLACAECPSCRNLTISVQVNDKTYLLWPQTGEYRAVPHDVPRSIREDFEQACAVLESSPKASAALSRRCLQHVLLDRAGVNKGSLSDQIDEVLAHSLPSQLAEVLDAVRQIGNFAAHPIKSQSTGEIVDVQPEEAEWNIEVLEMLFDHYYEQPRRTEERKRRLNEKLAETGKPPMKTPPESPS